jgi:hypothetical protein
MRRLQGPQWLKGWRRQWPPAMPIWPSAPEARTTWLHALHGGSSAWDPTASGQVTTLVASRPHAMLAKTRRHLV